MITRSQVRTVALAVLLLGAPAALEAQDGWNLPIDANRIIRSGETRRSSLDSGDRALGDGSYFEAWFFEGRAGQRVTITMRAAGFDTFLALGRHNADAITTNDDYESGTSTNSQISVSLPADGLYVIRANSLESGKTGDYSLSVEDGSGDGQADGSGSTTTAERVFALPVDRARLLQPGRQVTSSLDASDGQLADESYFEVHYLELRAGQRVTVTMRSGDFDTYLSLGSQGGSETQESNDDFEDGSTDSRIEFTASRAGTYVLIANSLESGETGSYTIVATVSGGVTGGEGVDKGATSRARPIILGQTVESDLGTDDERLDDGSHYEVWLFQGTAGSRVTITMRSSAFDAFLTVRDAAWESLDSDDDSGGNTDAQVTVTIPANGRIAIVANSLGQGETGRYTLHVVRAN